MEITHYLQLIVSAIVIVGAAGVALICDFLKSNNEQLREMNLELRVRHEEEQRRYQPSAMPAGAKTAIAPTVQSALPAPVTAMAVSESRMPAAVGQAAMDRAAEVTSKRGARHEDAEPATDRQPGSNMAEARMLAREFMSRAKDRNRETMTPDTSVQATPKAARRRAASQPAAAAPSTPEFVLERQAPAAPAPAGAAQTTSGRRNWDMLLKSNAQRRTSEPATIDVTAVESGAPIATKRMAELIPFETIQHGYAEANESAVPAGFQEPAVLTQLLESGKPVRGLVVAISINDFQSRSENENSLGVRTLIAAVSEHLRSMLRGGDFACPSAENEFVMICPGDRDAAAQRRLSEIAESLWNFQLRSVGTTSILFSWGGIEAKGEPIADAVGSAIERLQETRRSRRTLALDGPRRRKAV